MVFKVPVQSVVSSWSRASADARAGCMYKDCECRKGRVGALQPSANTGLLEPADAESPLEAI